MDMELIVQAIVASVGILMCLGIIIAAYAFFTQRNPNEYYWSECDPWDDCPDCKGTGKIDIGDGDEMECPCTQELI